MDKFNFYVISPCSKNINHSFLQECVYSVQKQKTTHEFHHHVILDVDNKGACRNHYEALQKIPIAGNNIVVHLDGDDFLIRDDVFNILANRYSIRNTLVTYGNYQSLQGSINRHVPNIPFRQDFAERGWGWSHLRTFRSTLIPYLKEESMKDKNNEWYTAAPDVAIFLPILEMAGNNRVEFIPEVLVNYRIHDDNEHSNQYKLRDQVRCAIDALYKPPYTQI